ncbi:allophanate hydrolase subunit 1 [Thiotrichales bacterium 19S9-12]|nr:allophanate hydrolase subunit 1 [Thiotrichales bacterium 19S9-11]MCF6812062.1 allophanate hydrolase subunit 1 [Thiotrichales bacterium 19S9-12]
MISYYLLGDQCLIFSFGDEISETLSVSTLTAYYYLKEQEILLEELKIYDLVPSYNALAVHLKLDSVKELTNTANQLTCHIQKALKIEAPQWLLERQCWKIDVRYNGCDLNNVAFQLGISERQVVQLHQSQEYQIAMLGFVPYFPYLMGLSPKLELPRRDKPRIKVDQGSVAIAGKQAGIYPKDSPGGWHILGKTDFDQFESLKPGDRLKFNAI